MPSLRSFGRYLPARVLSNDELAQSLGCTADWILQSSGIEQRRIAAVGETVVDMGVAAARDCLGRSPDAQVGLVIASCGTSDLRFPGPAAQIAHRLGLAGIPAVDLPIASAGSLFALALGAQLNGNVLVIATEKMSPPAANAGKNIAILFGDGAGACLIDKSPGGLQIIDSAIHSDGSFADALQLGTSGPLQMNGLAVIRHATQKLPEVIQEVLQRNDVAPSAVNHWILHQANQNLIDRVARTLGADPAGFYSNIARYGNTSSASMLIAASEWSEGSQPSTGDTVCFAAFGAGFHWGALLVRQT